MAYIAVMLKFLFSQLALLMLFFHAQATELPRSGFYTQAELLYWQAEEEGLSYAVESSSPRSVNGKAKNLKFEWDVGFNVGLGYRVSHDRWQLLLQFTSLQTHADANPSDHFFFPIWLSPPAALFATQVKAHWRLHLGLIDLLLSKPFAVTQTLTLTPQLGIRWGSARQKFNLEYRGGNFPPGEDISIRMKNKFQGFGPYAGLDADYAIASGFSLFARGAASLLYSEFYLHQDEDTLGTKEKILGLHFIYRAVSPILESSAGIRWHRFFTGCLKRLTLDVAWDQLLLFSQNQLLRFVASSSPGTNVANQGDLSIAGVHFTVAFDF